MSSVRMLLLIDENVPDSVAEFFRERGHDVRLVRELLPAGTADPVIATLGDEWGAIVVTWNHKDFKQLAKRVPVGERQRFRNLGRISFRCNEAKGRQRLEELIDFIEFEFASVQKRKDRRLLLEVGDSYLRLNR
jgi:predicted nuclease of predicted toxin-antitoxin system